MVRNNKRNFFKDRHWITREFPMLKEQPKEGGMIVAMEVGCGVGNTIFPLIKEHPHLFYYGLDFSKKAIDLMKVMPRSSLLESDSTGRDTMSMTNADARDSYAILQKKRHGHQRSSQKQSTLLH